MTAPVYLGNELSAAGWRLAGALPRWPRPGTEAAALAAACAEAPLVLLSASVAAAIGDAALRPVLAGLSPLVMVVPDLDGSAALPDLAQRLRVQLGLEA